MDKREGPNTDPENHAELSHLQNKLNSLKQRRKTKTADSSSSSSSQADKQSMNDGLKAGSELLVSMIAGGALGYGLDYWLNTKPIFFLLFIILGVGVGFLNIYKLTQNIGSSVGFAELHKKHTNERKQKKRDLD